VKGLFSLLFFWKFSADAPTIARASESAQVLNLHELQSWISGSVIALIVLNLVALAFFILSLMSPKLQALSAFLERVLKRPAPIVETKPEVQPPTEAAAPAPVEESAEAAVPESPAADALPPPEAVPAVPPPDQIPEAPPPMVVEPPPTDSAMSVEQDQTDISSSTPEISFEDQVAAEANAAFAEAFSTPTEVMDSQELPTEAKSDETIPVQPEPAIQAEAVIPSEPESAASFEASLDALLSAPVETTEELPIFDESALEQSLNESLAALDKTEPKKDPNLPEEIKI
jgi:hypothetical protein